MIEIRDVTRRYGERIALREVSLSVAPGEVVGLLGANGAGKSTLLRIAAGLLRPDHGTVVIAGSDHARDPLGARAKLGFAAEEPAFYEELSADEYLAFVTAVRAMDPAAARARARDLCGQLGLAGRTDEPVRGFSHGMRKKLSFIAAVIHRPPVLLCDEALEGFDAAAAIAARAHLHRLASDGAAVLFSSHVTETIERVCTRAVILHHGALCRALDRGSWGAATLDLSPLEREFLAVASAAAS